MMRLGISLLFAFPCIYGQQTANVPNLSVPDLITSVFTLPEMKHYVVQIKATHAKASVVCKTFGTELVSIPDAKTNEVLSKMILSSGEKYWTSGKMLSTGKWIWWHKLSLFYTNWDIGQPSNNPKHSCLLMLPSGEWEADTCKTEQYFICEGPNVTSSC